MRQRRRCPLRPSRHRRGPEGRHDAGVKPRRQGESRRAPAVHPIHRGPRSLSLPSYELISSPSPPLFAALQEFSNVDLDELEGMWAEAALQQHDAMEEEEEEEEQEEQEEQE